MVRVFPKSASQLNFNNTIIIWFSVFVLTDERLETDNLTIDNFTEIFFPSNPNGNRQQPWNEIKFQNLYLLFSQVTMVVWLGNLVWLTLTASFFTSF